MLKCVTIFFKVFRYRKAIKEIAIKSWLWLAQCTKRQEPSNQLGRFAAPSRNNIIIQKWRNFTFNISLVFLVFHHSKYIKLGIFMNKMNHTLVSLNNSKLWRWPNSSSHSFRCIPISQQWCASHVTSIHGDWQWTDSLNGTDQLRQRKGRGRLKSNKHLAWCHIC